MLQYCCSFLDWVGCALIFGKGFFTRLTLLACIGCSFAFSLVGGEGATTPVENTITIYDDSPLVRFEDLRELWQASHQLQAPYSGQAECSDCQAVALSTGSLQRDSVNLDERVTVLSPIVQFDIVLHVEIDRRAAVLEPLQRYSFWDSLLIAGEVGALTPLDDYRVVDLVSIDDRQQQLSPLVTLGRSSSEQAVVSASEPRLYLSEWQATFVSRAQYDDNFHASNVAPISSWTFMNELSTSFTLQRRSNTYLMSYSVRDGQVDNSPEDDYRDQRFYTYLRQNLNRINSVTFSASMNRTHEDRGSNGVDEGGVIFNVEQQLKLTVRDVDLRYQLGDESSTMRLISGLRYNDVRYDSAPALTNQLEYDQLQLNIQGLYRLGAKTDVTLQLARTNTDYLLDPATIAGAADTLDSSSQFFLAGIDRELGRHSSGRIRFGASRRDFSDPDRDAGLDGYWDAEFVWRPRSYSTVNIGFKSRFAESRGLGDYIATRETLLGWNHSWAQRLSSRISLRYAQDDYINFDRVDNRWDTNIRVRYTVNNRFSIASGARYHQRESTQDGSEFDRKVIFFESNFRL